MNEQRQPNHHAKEKPERRRDVRAKTLVVTDRPRQRQRRRRDVPEPRPSSRPSSPPRIARRVSLRVRLHRPTRAEQHQRRPPEDEFAHRTLRFAHESFRDYRKRIAQYPRLRRRHPVREHDAQEHGYRREPHERRRANLRLFARESAVNHSFIHSTHASMIHRAFARARTSVETRDSSRRAHLDLRRLLVDVDDARRHDDVVARGRLRRRRLSLRIARAASRDACRRETRCAIAARPRYASGRERTRRRAGERDARGGDRARRIHRGFREMN